MNRLLKIFYVGSFIIALSVINFSCSDDFLEEKVVGNLTTAYFETEAGMDALEVAMYQSFRFFFAEEHAYTMSNYGTDEFQVGGGTDYRYMNDYTSTMSAVDPKPLFSGLSDWWDQSYSSINTANMLIQNAPKYITDEARRDVYLGTGYFSRGFLFFRLVNQYNQIVLKLESSEIVEYEFTLATPAEAFDQLISDLRKAADLLPSTAEGGRLSKAAAFHFLAKAYLFRASERYADITKTNDLDSAIYYGLKVINKEDGTDRELASNYQEFWNYLEEGPDGPAEKSKEIILAAQYSNDQEKFDRLRNRTHLYFLPRYESGMVGMSRVIQYGRPYQRMRATDYAYDVFDRVNDSRFWKSFRTLYRSTAGGSGVDVDGNTQQYIAGETPCIKIIINSKNDSSMYNSKHAASTYPNYWLRYYVNDTIAATTLAVTKFAGLDKYLDPHRLGNQNDISGVRDGYLARVGETYLIVAEAYGRKGDYGNAVTYINYVRERAGFADGENRADANDAGSNMYFKGNTYYESTGITETTASTKTDMRIDETAFEADADAGIPYSAFGATSKAQKFIHFILNERSRELLGEFLRWEDLSRTKTLYGRTIPYNTDNAAPQLQANGSAGKFLLRPIPQTFLDQVQIEGRNLTDTEKNDWQNPGW